MNKTKKALTLALLITAVAPCNANIFTSASKIVAGLFGIGKSCVKNKPLRYISLGIAIDRALPYFTQDPSKRTPINQITLFPWTLPTFSNVTANALGTYNDILNIYDDNQKNRLIDDQPVCEPLKIKKPKKEESKGWFSGWFSSKKNDK